MEQSIGWFLAKRAHLSPRQEGMVDVASGRRFTYDEMNRRCNQTANLLKSLGAKKGDRVAFLMMNGAEFVESYFAVAKLGAVCVPLNWRLTPDELEFILKDSGASILIYSEEFAEVAAALHERGAKTDIQRWICHGTPDVFAQDYDKLQAEASDDEPPSVVQEEDLLFIMYTSGTTGLPKGVMHTHLSALWSSLTALVTADLRYSDRYLILLPMFHVGALNPVITAIHGGISVIVARSFDPSEVWRLIESEKISVMLAVPAMLNFMLQTPVKDEADFSSLRWVMSGAAPVPVELIRQYEALGIEIHQVYGLTESCGPACLISPADALARAGSTGKAFFHTEVRIADEAGATCPRGEIGEVLVRGFHVMAGYWNRPDATAETLRDGWLHTGDLAVMDEEGFVTIHDRKKDMIISGGENIYPAEIENVILSHSGVRDVAVIGQPSSKWGESPVAVIVRGEGSLMVEDVLRHCDGKLARFKCPKAVEFVDEIPRNPSGKALKRLLRDRFPGPAPE